MPRNLRFCSLFLVGRGFPQPFGPARAPGDPCSRSFLIARQRCSEVTEARRPMCYFQYQLVQLSQRSDDLSPERSSPLGALSLPASTDLLPASTDLMT